VDWECVLDGMILELWHRQKPGHHLFQYALTRLQSSSLAKFI
jgi:hypothetical protein